MRISTTCPSKYFRASDLQDEPRTYIIDTVTMEPVNSGEPPKPVVYFRDPTENRGLVLNKTNLRTLTEMYGDDTEIWSGRAVTLVPSLIEFRGEWRKAIRIQAPERKAPRQRKPATKKVAMADWEDKLPW